MSRVKQYECNASFLIEELSLECEASLFCPARTAELLLLMQHAQPITYMSCVDAQPCLPSLHIYIYIQTHSHHSNHLTLVISYANQIYFNRKLQVLKFMVNHSQIFFIRNIDV
ncbi:hypothetical protein L6164_010166 [Bauhinia variegata]|uniref:Uncharacterized protein n=1 Tax=Bauhinia variegata TaxID=167791 RepID=A0ACB9PLE2_BAUVA|nr:hypothetical protein L6164_010166 [Bauhinia variegata]